MTYKHLRKIQLYILIFLGSFIFTENIQLIFKTRSILETDQNLFKKLVFSKKSDKTEIKPNKNSSLIYFRSSKEVFLINLAKDIKGKHKQSISRLARQIDRGIFSLKRLIDGLILLLKKVAVSVKYRYLSSQKMLEQQRDIFLKELERVVGSRGLPLAKGILFGDLSGVSQETYHSFKVIGILHVLSASSANFTIFLQFFLFFLKPILGYLSKKQSFFLYFSIIFIYFSLVGSAASTVRAFLSLSLTFYATFILKRSFLSLFNLFITGFFMLIINPFYLETLGFQLSFLASFGIIFLYEFLKKELHINKNYLFESLILTFSAQFFLIPILLFKFSELNYLTVLANVLVLPLVEFLTILLLASFICLFLGKIIPLSLIEQFLSLLIAKILDILFFLIDFLEKIPWKSLVFKQDKELYAAIFMAINLLGILFVYLVNKKRYSKNQYRIFK